MTYTQAHRAICLAGRLGVTVNLAPYRCERDDYRVHFAPVTLDDEDEYITDLAEALTIILIVAINKGGVLAC